ncbi:hypothetical protein KIW84_013322 [Lathyrus oleraceus]|uniref:Uncharacterized protein n=1 Tax=Pisum sativum TaxID=3888 RepID=A0A9D5BK80_PEA|nr:hypothetical protein KIW84_013322 [Pisum sativum]
MTKLPREMNQGTYMSRKKETTSQARSYLKMAHGMKQSGTSLRIGAMLDATFESYQGEIRVLKMHQISFGGYTVDSLIPNTNSCQVLANQPYTLNQIKEQLVAMNNGLTIIENCISNDVGVSGFKLADEVFIDTDELSIDSSSLIAFSIETESVAARSNYATCSEIDPEKNTEIVVLLNNARKVDRARTHGDDLFESGQFIEACLTYGDGLKVNPFEFCPVSQYSSMLA